MKFLYHATPEENAGSILAVGLRPSADGYVYLAESIEDARKFLWHEQSNIWIFSVRMREDDNALLEETFDHSRAFFRCRAFGYRGTIPPDRIDAVCMVKGSE